MDRNQYNLTKSVSRWAVDILDTKMLLSIGLSTNLQKFTACNRQNSLAVICVISRNAKSRQKQTKKDQQKTKQKTFEC